jgi:hypothetical protein
MAHSYLKTDGSFLLEDRIQIDSIAINAHRFSFVLCLFIHYLSVFCVYRKTRDDLSHHIFCMLQECNKFREHQARETLITLMEKEIAERKKLTQELLEYANKAEQVLNKQRDDVVEIKTEAEAPIKGMDEG